MDTETTTNFTVTKRDVVVGAVAAGATAATISIVAPIVIGKLADAAVNTFTLAKSKAKKAKSE